MARYFRCLILLTWWPEGQKGASADKVTGIRHSFLAANPNLRPINQTPPPLNWDRRRICGRLCGRS